MDDLIKKILLFLMFAIIVYWLFTDDVYKKNDRMQNLEHNTSTEILSVSGNVITNDMKSDVYHNISGNVFNTDEIIENNDLLGGLDLNDNWSEPLPEPEPIKNSKDMHTETNMENEVLSINDNKIMKVSKSNNTSIIDDISNAGIVNSLNKAN